MNTLAKVTAQRDALLAIVEKVLAACNAAGTSADTRARLDHVLYREVQQHGAALLSEIARDQPFYTHRLEDPHP